MTRFSARTSSPSHQGVGLEVNASSYKIRKPIQRKMGTRGGKKASKKAQVGVLDAQGAQGGKGKQEATPLRNDMPYGQQDQKCYKCGIWGH
ncbi:hypothetical protein E2562_013428 [Oryza meyeriana var. granulata]|uniref:Uncharacterized protein n=1 Tax=Oryza meyeriana var. granulata TaxID=110450 RepID=A0A6G1EAJ8_9ORYZ|nr:hypothetical protein E2562_013428 [Oryza meyeriana var. granulata]